MLVLGLISAAAARSDTLAFDSLPSPWYFDHEMALDMLGIGLVPLPCHPDPEEGGYVPKVEEAEALITSRTRAIIIVTPNNRECAFGRKHTSPRAILTVGPARRLYEKPPAPSTRRA